LEKPSGKDVIQRRDKTVEPALAGAWPLKGDGKRKGGLTGISNHARTYYV